MILRIRQPDGTNRDTKNVPASARSSGGSIGGERVTPIPMGHAEDQRRYRARKAAAA